MHAPIPAVDYFFIYLFIILFIYNLFIYLNCRRFPEGAGDHLEIPQNEVPQPQAAAIAANLSAAAQAWWTSVIREPGSFSKPTFYLGLANWTVSNVLAAGAHDRTPGRVRLLMMGAAGFERTGDYMCFKLQVRRCVSGCNVYFML